MSGTLIFCNLNKKRKCQLEGRLEDTMMSTEEKNIQQIIETDIDLGEKKRVHTSFGVVNA